MRKSLTAWRAFRESLSAVEGHCAGVGALRSRVSDQLSVTPGDAVPPLPPSPGLQGLGLGRGDPKEAFWPTSVPFALACLSLKSEFHVCGQLGALWWPFWAELWAAPLPTGSWCSWRSLALTSVSFCIRHVGASTLGTHVIIIALHKGPQDSKSRAQPSD